jgi:sulfoxide reductase catalytic subunit YedY
MISFDPAHAAVYFPEDRRFRIWIRPSFLIGLATLAVLPVLFAWVQLLTVGLPYIPPLPQVYPNAITTPHGFPLWLRYCHFFNFIFLMMLIRSGISILYDHPRLYFNNDCTPGSEWIRLTPIIVPRDHVWTAKEDARYITPIVATPGYHHTVGIARSWHFLNVYGFIVTGLLFIVMLFDTEQWRRLVPQSALIFISAWNTWVHYATFHLPPEPNGFFAYNGLQQLAYFSVVFLLGPMAILTGIAMSPAVVNRFPWYARLFGGRQSARSLHFLTMAAFLAFIVVHVALVAMTGVARNMNHIVMGTDSTSSLGTVLGFLGISAVILSWVGAHYISWFYPRVLQHVQKSITYPLELMTINRLPPSEHYTEKDISPRFWSNGKLPQREDWRRMSDEGFSSFRLKVGGLVEHPVELSLADLATMGQVEDITMQHCIQGWSGIAKWGGLPMKTLVELVKPMPNAKVVAFFSFGGSMFGDLYYDTQSLENVLKAECILATEMNGQPLTEQYGAPLRLRVENQLGYKMIKWIERIEFIESEKSIGKGEGGTNEDDEYFDLLPNI